TPVADCRALRACHRFARPQAGGAVRTCCVSHPVPLRRRCREKRRKRARGERATEGAGRRTDAAWSTVRNSLKGVIGDNNYITWIAPLRLAEARDGVVRLAAPTNFVANWVNRHYADHILRCLIATGESVSRVEVSVDPRTAPGPDKAP